MALAYGAGAQGQRADTIVGRCERYYYETWYDECASYQTPDYSFYLRNNYSCFLAEPGNKCRTMIAKEYYTPEPLTIYGLAAMVKLDVRHDSMYINRLTDSIQARASEVLVLFQASRNYNQMSSYYYPPILTPIDSVRWDTASAKVMMLPRNMYAVAGDSGGYEQCLVYEARFERPVTVDSFFYIGGTFRSNTMEGEEYVYSYLPTVYQTFVEDADVDGCLYCQPQRRLFRNDVYIGGRFMGEWLIQNDKYGMGYTAGPFFPVIRY